MLAFYATIFCLIVSFVFGSKKMKVKSISQAVLAVVLAILVFFFVPNAPLSHLIDPSSLAIIQDVLTDISNQGVSVTSIILYAIFFLTILSFFEIVEYVKEQFEKYKNTQKEKLGHKSFIYKVHSIFEQKIYLLFCRLLN